MWLKVLFFSGCGMIYSAIIASVYINYHPYLSMVIGFITMIMMVLFKVILGDKKAQV